MQGHPEQVLPSHPVVKVSVHLAVHLINNIHCCGEINEELSDFLRTVLFLDVPTLGEGPQEIGLVRSGEKSHLRSKHKHQLRVHAVMMKPCTDLEELLNKPAVVSFQGHFVGFGHVDSNQVWVALILLTIGKALEEDLNESQTSGGEKM